MQQPQNIDDLARELANGLSLDDLRRRQSGGYVSPGAIAEPTPEQLRNIERFKEIRGTPIPKETATPIRVFTQEMDYEDARRRFWAILQYRAAEIEMIEDRPFKWVFDEIELENIRNIIRYFINDPSGKLPLKKGLFVFGKPGNGKTEIVQAVQKFCDQYELKKAFKYTSLSDVYTKAKTDKEYDPIAENVQFDRALDEFARHTGPVIRFGDSLDILETIVEFRYVRSNRYGQITHFIANLTPNELQERCTPMVLDRIKSMCTGVYFPGESKRK